MNKFFLLSAFVLMTLTTKAQMLHGPSGYMLLNLSSEKCKFWATSTRSLSNINTRDGKFETVVYNGSLESINDSLTTVFSEKYLDMNEYTEIRLNGFVYGFDKMDLSKEIRQAVTFRGSLLMHGIKRELEFTGNIYNRPSVMMLDYELYVDPEQFGLKAPADISKCISPVMQIKGNVQLVNMSND